MNETQEKADIETEIIIAIAEAKLLIDKPITTVERDCQHQEAKTEALFGRTRNMSSSQKQR